MKRSKVIVEHLFIRNNRELGAVTYEDGKWTAVAKTDENVWFVGVFELKDIAEEAILKWHRKHES